MFSGSGCLRSWAGDLSSKFGKIDMTSGFTMDAVDYDPNLGWNSNDMEDAYGTSKLIGQSVVVHSNITSARIACGQICTGSKGCDIASAWAGNSTYIADDLQSSCSNLAGACSACEAATRRSKNRA